MMRAVRCSPDSRTLVPQAAQSPYPTSSYWVCTLCFYLQRTLVPLPTAVSIYPSPVNQFFSRFGCPFQVFTDQGRNFESSLFREMCELLHIHKSRTTPYPMFPGLPNISSAGSPISLPNIIILGVYPVLLFTEDLSAPANCGKYLSQLR
jgi:hypothetical protein